MVACYNNIIIFICLKCQIACERKEKMAVLWQNSSPMVITVKTQLPDDKNWILLERWTVEAVDG